MIKIQEIPSIILLKCKFDFQNNLTEIKKYSFNCDKSLQDEIAQELFKRFYKPLYIPIIALMSCFLIIVPKNNNYYKKNRKNIFFLTLLIIIFSEATLRYSSISKLSSFIYFVIPWILFISIYLIFYKRTQNA